MKALEQWVAREHTCLQEWSQPAFSRTSAAPRRVRLHIAVGRHQARAEAQQVGTVQLCKSEPAGRLPQPDEGLCGNDVAVVLHALHPLRQLLVHILAVKLGGAARAQRSEEQHMMRGSRRHIERVACRIRAAQDGDRQRVGQAGGDVQDVKGEPLERGASGAKLLHRCAAHSQPDVIQPAARPQGDASPTPGNQVLENGGARRWARQHQLGAQGQHFSSVGECLSWRPQPGCGALKHCCAPVTQL